MNKKILLILALGMFLISLTSAMTFDNWKSIEGNRVTIIDNFNLGDRLVEVEKISNTDKCLYYCETIWNVTIYDDEDDFLSEIEFEDVNGNNKNIEYNFEYFDNDKWKKFNPKRKLSPGNYLIRLSGHKQPEESIDWIPTIYGERIDEWAWWIGVAPTVYYKFNEGINDTVGFKNLSGEYKQVPGKLGNAQGYNGTFSNNASGTDLQFDTEVFTVAFWLNMSNGIPTNRRQGIIDYLNGWVTTDAWAIGLEDLSGSERIHFVIGGDAQHFNFAVTPDSQWKRYVFVKEGAGSPATFKLYVDGVGETNTTVTSAFNIVANLTIGEHPSLAASTGDPLNQSLDDVLIYKGLAYLKTIM
jgi:hypothetical protein